MTTDDFIDILEQRHLVPASVTRQLRAKAAQGDTRITPKSILKYLVKKEMVSRAQAKELLETTIVVSDKAESSILGLAPLVDAEPKPAAKPPKPARLEPPEIAEPAAPAKPAAKVKSPARSAFGDDLFAVPSSPAGPTYLDEDDAIVPLEAADEVEALQDAPAAPGSKLRTAPRKPKKGKKESSKKPSKLQGQSEWDSPLLLLGGGGVALLVLASVVLWFLVFREGADALLKKAHDAFDRGSYQEAHELYKEFRDKYASHPEYSKAKVRVGMTQLWEAASGRNYARAAEMAPGIITEIENEPAFISDADDPDGLSTAKRELSRLLTKVATGLVDQAESATEDEEAKKRIDALKMVLALTSNTKYVPQKFRLDNDLKEIQAKLERVETRLQRDADLATALAQMDEAIKRGEPAAALAVRATLLTNHPSLEDNEGLAAKVLEISAAEKAGIKFVEAGQAAATDAPASPVVAELALADRRGDAAATPANAATHVVTRIDGALYGLNAIDGALLWRRFAGLDGSAPLVLPNGQVVAADSQRGEVVCVEAPTGKLLWRLPLEGQLATPVAAGERLLVASDSGKLFVIHQATGELQGHVPFTQPLRLPPVLNDRGDRIYVLGEHSNLYTLSGADLSCLGVYYMGHAAGGVAAPPITVLNKVVVADNSGDQTCRLRVVSLNDQGVAASEAANHRLSGLVITPIQTEGRRVAIVTTLNQAVVFEIGGGSDESALTVLAAREAQDKEPLARFALLDQGHLWIAGRDLTKLAVLPTGNQLPVRSLDRDYHGDAFDYPLQTIGGQVIHVRRAAGQAGAIVAAMDATANRPVWETELAVPAAGPPAVDASGLRMTAGAATGAVYLLDREAMTKRVQDRAERLAAQPGQNAVFTESLDLSQGRLLLGGVGGARLLHFRPGDPRQPLTAVEVPAPLSCPPVAWGDGFVAATNVGQVYLYDADSATPNGAAFQPELTPGRKYKWLRPAVVGEGPQSRLAISDGVAKLYLVSRNAQPQPHLAEAASADVGPSPLVTPLAVAGSRIFAGTEAGPLASFSLPALTPNESIDVGGRVSWGPHVAGDGVLMATEAGELMLVGGDGAVRWRQPVKRGDFGGTPLVDGGNAFVLYPADGVARISLDDGAEAGFVELGQPAVVGPVAFGPRLVVTAADGTLLVVNRP